MPITGERESLTVMLEEISKKCKLNNEEKGILEEYIKNRFDLAKESDVFDTDFLKVWKTIIDYGTVLGASKAINDKVCPKRPVEFRSPQSIEMEIYDSVAGEIPVIYARDSQDFEQLITNIAYKGIRPDNISSIGALFIYGNSTRFAILSAKSYSNVSASELGLSDEKDWEEKSLIIRRGHECTHYFTKQVYGITNNILHDEIMADFMGMYEAFGFFKAEWFLKFMGLIPGSGNRLIVYTEGLPENVRNALAEIAKTAAYNLENWSNTQEFKEMSLSDRIKHMCKLGIEGIINL